MNRVLERFKNDSFYRHTVLFVSASLITSVLNYLYYPLMGRLVGVEGYGELQIVTSFLLQITTVFVGLNLISVNIVTNHDEAEAKKLMVALQKSVFWLVALACAGIALVSGQLQHFFQFTSPWPFLLIIPALLVDALAVFWTAYLQAKRDFRSLSAYSIFTGIGKIVFSVGLVLLGFGVSGGILGIALGLWGSLILVRLITKHDLPPLSQTLLLPNKHERQLIRAHLVYILEVIVALVGMSILLSIDTIIVKHFYTPDAAGLYAGVATVARIIFFACAPIVSVMLPAITLKHFKKSRQAFRRTLALSALIGTTGLIIMSLFPDFVIRVLLGPEFTANAEWLPLLAILAIILTITNVIVNYLLALRSHLGVVVSLSSLAAASVLLVWHHQTIPQIVLAACSGLLIGQLIFWIYNLARRGVLGQSTEQES